MSLVKGAKDMGAGVVEQCAVTGIHSGMTTDGITSPVSPVSPWVNRQCIAYLTEIDARGVRRVTGVQTSMGDIKVS
jgi:hypothetical protein